MARRDRLGEFLRQYDEYLDGARSYYDLPDFPGSPRDQTWERYSPHCRDAVRQQSNTQPEMRADLPAARVITRSRR